MTRLVPEVGGPDTISATDIAYDRDKHTDGISAVGAAVFDRRGDLYAISIPTRVRVFLAEEREVPGNFFRHTNTLSAWNKDQLPRSQHHAWGSDGGPRYPRSIGELNRFQRIAVVHGVHGHKAFNHGVRKTVP